MRNYTLLFAVLLLHAIGLKAQSSFLPQSLGSNVNTEYAELNPVISSDGKTLFFNRINHPDNHYGEHNSQDIWYSEKQSDGSWGPAKRLDVVFNKARHNAIICALSNDTYLINGTYTKSKKPEWLERGYAIVTVKEGKWSNPKNIKIRSYVRLNEGVKSNAWMSQDRKVIVLSFSHHYNGKHNNLYVSFDKGRHFSKPKKLGKIINSRKTNEEAPFISSNSDVLYFTSNRHAGTNEGNKKNYQIFKTNRLDETWLNWSTPTPLNDTINSDQWDSYFRTNEKGSWAYFASTKNAKGESDLYKVKLYEDQPFVMVKGKVMDKSKNQPLAKGKQYTVLADGEPIDSVTVNSDSSTFQIKLPFGRKYSIAASAKNYQGIPEEIDAKGLREFTEVHKDLYLRPSNFVLVSGNVLVHTPRGIVPEESHPKISVNGAVIDSIQIKFPEGAYELRLPFGKNYTVAATAAKYLPNPVKFKFDTVHEYREIKKDLFVSTNPMATIKGTFLVKGTNAKIPLSAHPRLMINGEIVDSVQIDTNNLTYRAFLPIKKKYALSVSATKYQGITDTVNLTSILEPTELSRNLYATKVSTSALLSGIIINRKTNKPISTKELVKIQSNGSDIPGAKFDPETGNYEVEIALGTSHTISANIPNYFPQFEVVDLTKEKTNVKLAKDLYVTPLEIGQSVKLNNIFFESSKSTLKPKSFPELNKVVKFLKDNPTIDIQIEGHTDNVGKPDANIKLSRWRARSVQQYLVGKGIDVKRVKFDGFGANKPVAKNTTAQGRSLNRRVEFKILSLQ